EAGLWGRGIFLPAGDDPDTFVRVHGGKAFTAKIEEAVEKAEPLIDAFMASLVGPRLDAVGRRAEAAKEVARVLEGVANPNERERALADCIGKIQARQSGRSRGVVLEALRAAEARGDVAAARVAQEELNRFLSEKNRT